MWDMLMGWMLIMCYGSTWVSCFYGYASGARVFVTVIEVDDSSQIKRTRVLVRYMKVESEG